MSSLEDSSSDSSLSDDECEDHWAATQKEAAKEGDWEPANKIMAFPITIKNGRRSRRVTWEQILITN